MTLSQFNFDPTLKTLNPFFYSSLNSLDLKTMVEYDNVNCIFWKYVQVKKY